MISGKGSRFLVSGMWLAARSPTFQDLVPDGSAPALASLAAFGNGVTFSVASSGPVVSFGLRTVGIKILVALPLGGSGRGLYQIMWFKSIAACFFILPEFFNLIEHTPILAFEVG